jgi:hypothetical protein
MDDTVNQSILAAIEQGRAGRGRSIGLRSVLDAAAPRMGAATWTRVRALVLTWLGEGYPRAVVGEELGVGTERVGQLQAEGCDAVLRGGGDSAAADVACAPVWQWWCEQRTDQVACARLRRGAPTPAEGRP